MPSVVTRLLAIFGFSVAWIFPASIVLGAGSLFLLPAVHAPGLAQRLTGPNGVLIYTLTVAFVGVTMGTLSTPLYHLLEGYSWPDRLRRPAVSRQKRAKAALEDRVRRAGSDDPLRLVRLVERWRTYPLDDRQIMPTRFGNALRALESYGPQRYQLDSQALWPELVSMAPKAIQDEVAGSRVGVDFFVAMLYLTAIYGLGALVLAAGRWLFGLDEIAALVIEGGVVLVLGPYLSYLGAIYATDYYGSTVRAMVNLGRPGLAKAFGLTMPTSFAGERALWTLLSRFVTEPDDDLPGAQLDAFRTAAELQAPRRAQ